MLYLSQQNKFILKLLFLLFIISNLNSCNMPWQESLISQKQTFYVFGTQVNIELLSDTVEHGQQTINSIEKRFNKFNLDWHSWEKGGIISKINNAIEKKQPIKVPSTVKEFIQKSQQLCRDSQGFFEPGIGKLIASWGFHSEEWHGPPPSESLIKTYLATKASILDIYFKANTLYSNNPEVKLDFSGNAKGLALDIAIQTLNENAIKNAIINIGGDMQALGSNNGIAWKIGIQQPSYPSNNSNPIAIVELNDGESIMTSGTYRRYFKWQGKRFSHLINPKTAMPIDIEKNHFISVTIIHKDAITADVAATALIVAGPNNWQAVAKTLKVDMALLIDKYNTYYMTQKMKDRLKFIN